MFFEGPEKTLEVWFKCDNAKKTLRSVPDETWVPMLDLVNCQVLSHVRNKFCHAYLLSESSFFVFDSFVLLKTCGTTTLLLALDKLLEIAQCYGFEDVENVFYSRQNFFNPSRQLEPHKSFKDEATVLNERFLGGSPLMLGNINGNHYKFYNWEDANTHKTHPNITCEFLMTGLDDNRMKELFYKKAASVEQKAGEESGINFLLNGLADPNDYQHIKIDEHIFDPFGYSMNALLGPYYYTIHVTPQDVCSYASFETNLLLVDYSELCSRILEIFRPTHFMCIVVDFHESAKGFSRLPKPVNYVRKERCMYEFDAYSVAYVSFTRMDNVSPCSRRVSPGRSNSGSNSPITQEEKNEYEKQIKKLLIKNSEVDEDFDSGVENKGGFCQLT